MRISDWSSDVCSSDLPGMLGRHALRFQLRQRFGDLGRGRALRFQGCLHRELVDGSSLALHHQARRGQKLGAGGAGRRSEEHTSELQSLMRISYAVFCLKKKKQSTSKQMYSKQHNTTHTHSCK